LTDCSSRKVEHLIPLDDYFDRQTLVMGAVDVVEAHRDFVSEAYQLVAGDLLSPPLEALKCAFTARKASDRAGTQPTLQMTVFEAKVHEREHHRARVRI
jgi:hypothetical protein